MSGRAGLDELPTLQMIAEVRQVDSSFSSLKEKKVLNMLCHRF